MGDINKVIKDIKIKTGVVKRLYKEKLSYQCETSKLQEKLDEMRSKSPEDYSLKKQASWFSQFEELLNESKQMISDCDKRFVAAWDELSRIMDIEKHLNETEEYKAAQVALDETRSCASKG
ncbi:hypothetical protein HELRODRAFT_169501 [Helobdella robusta]|uniref:Tubulin-specific chaperone A n=1 Tax=Helobdella robusta TaxID=6412 RepID=T1F207_HELRO|nr:hypothetical protein HELRODRAFT_169501 [Helobdella robusta]ESO08621.1 hypothetical protein HELRODRAFT_169501 [Helobdella robusta]